MNGAEAYNKAIELLRQGITPGGYLAATGHQANYHRIWARDGIITGLSALLTNDKELIAGLRKTILTLKANQHKTGMIPSNVEIDAQGKVKEVSYGTITGKVDADLWFIIGTCLYFKKTQDQEFKDDMLTAIRKIFKVLAMWEFNGRGLLYVPQGGNWADEFVMEGYNLSEQFLYYWALSEAAQVYESDLFSKKAQRLKELIVINYWPHEENIERAYHKTAYHKQLAITKTDYWMAGFKSSGYYNYFDCFAHALSFMLEINSTVQKKKITASINTITTELKDFLVPSFYPFIKETGDAWNTLQSNWTYQFRNFPGEYQNGGVWPIFNGLLIAGLYKSNENVLADKLRQALYRAVEMPDKQYGFYEYLDANNWTAGGVNHQLWSAAGVIFVENAAHNNFII